MQSTDFNDLKSWRQNGLRPRVTQQGIATALGLKTLSTVSLIENGHRVPADDVAKWAAQYSLSESEFKRLNACMSPDEWAARDRVNQDSGKASAIPSTGLAAALATTGGAV